MPVGFMFLIMIRIVASRANGTSVIYDRAGCDPRVFCAYFYSITVLIAPALEKNIINQELSRTTVEVPTSNNSRGRL